MWRQMCRSGGGLRCQEPCWRDPGPHGEKTRVIQERRSLLQLIRAAKQSSHKSESLDTDNDKLDAELAAVERIGASLDQARTSLEEHIIRECRQVLQTAAAISESPTTPDPEPELVDSDAENGFLADLLLDASSPALPVVTPQTADNIL
ncbi:hypothetical protein NDU88_006554 [Pleurodeles waltl]|uniref:Uncharacterized protein n=1 Tax=Pleurodeles waltl TaxID=8319 RepID=A0AAV7SQ02_PLEWA|nr:hypothetical protein NDU88_006554 [Pleurodeles waltl]